MKLYLPITVDLYNIYPLRVLNLQQNNIGRGALITLTAAGTVIVPDSESLYVYALKPDGTEVYNTCTLKDNQIQVDFDEQMTAVPGILQVELQMVDTTGNSITTPIFQVNVQNSNIDYERIASSDEFQALIDMINSVDELKKTGLKGDKGDAATIQVGTVTASEAGSVPTITNRGTAQKAIFDFVLPRGEQGPRGQAGPADATDVSYNNGTSGAAETNAQDALDKLYGDIANLTEKRAWTRIAHIEKATSGKVDISAATLKTAKEYMIGWRLFPSHPWTYSVSFNVTSEIMSSMYFSDTYRASLALTIAADGTITINTEWTGGKHGTTPLAAKDNLDLYVYMR